MTVVRTAKLRLLAHALSLPGAWEDHPWEETVAKVGKKVFVFFGQDSDDLFVGVKLERSLLYARSLPCARKFGYGLDRAGWVALRFTRDDEVPVDAVCEWIDESHDLVAPKSRAARVVRESASGGSMRERSIAQYIAKAGDWRGSAMSDLDAMVRNAAPKASSSIKWAQSVYEQDGPFAYMKLNARHVTFGFWRGGELTDPKGLLEGGGGRMKHVKIKQPADIDRRQFTAWVKQAIKLNAVEGDPTKRR